MWVQGLYNGTKISQTILICFHWIIVKFLHGQACLQDFYLFVSSILGPREQSLFSFWIYPKLKSCRQEQIQHRRGKGLCGYSKRTCCSSHVKVIGSNEKFFQIKHEFSTLTLTLTLKYNSIHHVKRSTGLDIKVKGVQLCDHPRMDL